MNKSKSDTNWGIIASLLLLAGAIPFAMWLSTVSPWFAQLIQGSQYRRRITQANNEDLEAYKRRLHDQFPDLHQPQKLPVGESYATPQTDAVTPSRDIQSDSPALKNDGSHGDWNEPDWRTVDGIRECVWTDKGWITFAGAVKAGIGYRKLVVSGYLLVEGNSLKSVFGLDDNEAEFIAPSYRGGWADALGSSITNGWLAGKNMNQLLCTLSNYPKEPRINDTLLIRVKPSLQHSENLTGPRWDVMLDYGFVSDAPTGFIDSELAVKRKGIQDLTSAYLLALRTAQAVYIDRMAPKQRSRASVAAENAQKEEKTLLRDLQDAEEGFASSEYSLGLRYLKGDGTIRDERIGRQWLEKASAHGDLDAKTTLAALKYNIGINDRVIMKELKFALQDADSYQYKIGTRFLNGDGVAQDTKFAKEWLGKAAGNGNVDAKKALSTISP